jgi:hypothetical protein
MDKVRKPSNSVCYTSSSEPYRIYLYWHIVHIAFYDTLLGYGLDDGESAVRFQVAAEDFSLLHRTQTGSVAPRRTPWALSAGVKRLGREADLLRMRGAVIYCNLHGLWFKFRDVLPLAV